MEQDKLELLVLEVLGEVRGMRSEMGIINQRLEKLEQGQSKLEQGQEEIKQCIRTNNVAIAEIMTKALEDHDRKTQETYITKKEILQLVK